MIAPSSPISRIPPSRSPRRRPGSSPLGRAGINPPSHHVTPTSGIPSRAGNLKRTIVERGNISFFACDSSKNACQYFETLASTLSGT